MGVNEKLDFNKQAKPNAPALGRFVAVADLPNAYVFFEAPFEMVAKYMLLKAVGNDAFPLIRVFEVD